MQRAAGGQERRVSAASVRIISQPPIRRRPEAGLVIGRQVGAQPFGRDGLVVGLQHRLLVDDAAGCGELDRQPGIVLEIDDALGGPAARGLRDRDLAGQQIAELVHLILADHALLDRIEQFGLIVVDHALPVIDDDGVGALVGAAVDFGALVGDVGIGDRDDELSVLQPVAVEHRLHRGGGAAHDVGAGDRGLASSTATTSMPSRAMSRTNASRCSALGL